MTSLMLFVSLRLTFETLAILLGVSAGVASLSVLTLQWHVDKHGIERAID